MDKRRKNFNFCINSILLALLVCVAQINWNLFIVASEDISSDEVREKVLEEQELKTKIKSELTALQDAYNNDKINEGFIDSDGVILDAEKRNAFIVNFHEIEDRAKADQSVYEEIQLDLGYLNLLQLCNLMMQYDINLNTIDKEKNDIVSEEHENGGDVSVDENESKIVPEVVANQIYANGIALIIEGMSPVNTTIYIDSNGNGKVDANENSLMDEGIKNAPVNASDLSQFIIWGGSSSDKEVQHTNIIMNGGCVDRIKGGSLNGDVFGNTSILLKNSATVIHSVSGGSDNGVVFGSTQIILKDQVQVGMLIGGSYDYGVVSKSIEVQMQGGTVLNNEGGASFIGNFGGSSDAEQLTFTMYGGVVNGSIYANNGNDNSLVERGKIVMNILGGSIRKNISGNSGNGSVSAGINKLQLSGMVEIGDQERNGVDLKSFKDGKIEVLDALSSGVEAVTLVKPVSNKDGTVVVSSAIASNMRAEQFSYANKDLFNSGTAIILDTRSIEPVIVTENNRVYAQGNALLIMGTYDYVTDKGSTTIYIDENRDGQLDEGEKSLAQGGIDNAPVDNAELGDYVVFGGSGIKDIVSDAQITMKGGNIKVIYGAGENEFDLTGNVKVTIEETAVVNNFLTGGPRKGELSGNISIYIKDNAYVGEILSASSSSVGVKVDGDCSTYIEGGTIDLNLNGIDFENIVSGTTNLYINGTPKRIGRIAYDLYPGYPVWHAGITLSSFNNNRIFVDGAKVRGDAKSITVVATNTIKGGFIPVGEEIAEITAKSSDTEFAKQFLIMYADTNRVLKKHGVKMDVKGENLLIADDIPIEMSPETKNVKVKTAFADNIAYYGQDYSFTLEPESSKYLLPDTITISCGSKILSAQEFAYNNETGEVTIDGKYIKDDVSVKAIGKRNYRKVTFHSNDGDPVNPIEDTLIDDDLIPKPGDPGKQGYTFAGWFKDNNTFLNEWNFASDKVAGNLDLYAKWKAIPYAITFMDEGVQVRSSDIDYNTTLGTLPNPLGKSGYTFLGWFDANNVKASSSTIVKQATVYQAQYKVIDYVITYDLRGGTNHQLNPKSYTINDNEIKILAPSRPGYVFRGWSFNSPNAAIEMQPIIAKNSTGNRIYYAQFMAKNYQVNYQSNNGSGIASKNVGWDEANLLPNIQLKRAGYTFVGWYYKDILITNAIAYRELALNEAVETIVLSARWQIINNSSQNGGSSSGKGSASATPKENETSESSTTQESAVSKQKNSSGTIKNLNRVQLQFRINGIEEDGVTFNKQKYVKAILTRSQIERLEENKSSYVIEFLVNRVKKISNKEEKLISDTLDKNEMDLEGYHNVRLRIKENKGSWRSIDEINDAVEIPFLISKQFQDKEGSFFGIRIHNGSADLLQANIAKDDLVLVSSDQFSLYALAYQADESSIQQNSVLWIVVVLFICLGFGIVYFYIRKTKRKDFID